MYSYAMPKVVMLTQGEIHFTCMVSKNNGDPEIPQSTNDSADRSDTKN